MPYPINEFQYSQMNSGIRFETHETGIPEIKQLIMGRPDYWVSPIPSKKTKNKTLILADWSAPIWTTKKIDEVIEAMETLMTPRNGRFEIYAWQSGTLVKLTLENLSLLRDKSFRNAMGADSLKSIEKSAIDSQLKLTSDSIHVLDDYWINHLLSKDETKKPRDIHLSDLFLLNQLEQERVFQFLHHANPKPQRIIIDYFSVDALQRVESLKAIFPDCEVIEREYEYAKLGKNQIDKLFNQESVEYPGMKPFQITPSLENLDIGMSRGIISFMSDISISISELQTLFQQTSHLCRLNLNAQIRAEKDGKAGSEGSNWPLMENLEEFHLSLSDFDIKILLPLLNKMPHLKDFELYDCKNLAGLFDSFEGNFQNLVRVGLKYADFPVEELYALIRKAPNLKDLDLSDSKINLDDVFERLDAQSLQSLECINLQNARFTYKGLKALLKKAPHLKIIELSDEMRPTHFLSFEVFQSLNQGGLQDLKQINLNNFNLIKLEDKFEQAQVLQNLLIKASSLKYLSLVGSNIGELFEFMQKESLKNLEYVDLSETNLTASGLKALLSKATNLNSLDLSNCQEIDGLHQILDDENLPNLERIYLRETYISAEDLRSLLSKASNLKVLDLSYCTTLREEFLTGLNLENLEKIYFYKTNFSPEVLKALFNAAPKLDRDAVLTELNQDKDLYKVDSKPSIPPGVELMDADTSLKPSKFQMDRVFYSLSDDGKPFPSPHLYRKDVFHEAGVNGNPCSLMNAFFLKKDEDIGLEKCDFEWKSSDESLSSPSGGSLYGGKQIVHLTNEWQAIASLSPQEMILRCHANPPVENIQIQYSRRDNLYYIRSQNPEQMKLEVELDFTVWVPDPNEMAPLPQEIQALINKFRGFTPGPLIMPSSEELTGENYLQALLDQKKGACRHRAFAFKSIMDKQYPQYPTRIITNTCHAFVEFYVKGIWHVCDLGGYPAGLVINEQHIPRACPSAPEQTHTTIRYPQTEVIATPVEAMNSAFFEKALQTWNREAPFPFAIDEYCQECFAPDRNKKRLIECKSSAEVNALCVALQSYGNKTSHEVFYVNSPDDLVCKSSFVDANGALQKGPGGPLYDFLHNCPNGIIIVNYEHFDPSDIVRSNTLLDKDRQVDGFPLPPDMKVIGLANLNKPNVYQGSDFYSRFDKAEGSPIDLNQLHKKFPLPVDEPDQSKPSTTKINLFHANDWRERLLGRWVFGDSNLLIYQEGELKKIFDSGIKSIEIQNGLWDNPDFTYFWQSACTLGYIEHAGRRINLPKEFCLSRKEGYDWEALKTSIQAPLGHPPELVLNPITFNEFFSRFKIIGSNFVPSSGHLQDASKEKPLSVYLTQPLSDDAWARLLSECQEKKIALMVYCAPGVPLALALQTAPKAIIEERLTPFKDISKTQPTQVIQSTDVDTTVALLTAESPHDWRVVDITELHDSDILKRVTGKLGGDPLRFEFSEEKCDILKALDAGDHIILKGHFSEELAAELASFLIQRQKETQPKGTLVLVNDDTPDLGYALTCRHEVSIKEKEQFLPKKLSSDLVSSYPSEPLSRLQCRAYWLSNHPSAATSIRDSDKAWEGLGEVARGVLPLMHFNPEQSKSDAEAFIKKRKEDVFNALKDQPCVILTGLSGVGKTTCVNDLLAKGQGVLFQGEDAIKDWALDKGDHLHLLFIDEATLSPSEWTIFEGLFHSPANILINGKLHNLTPQHKVIFSGNPVSYGDERKLASFFDRHGNSVWFDPLPSAVLYEQILKPVFKKTGLEHQIPIYEYLMNVYRFLVAHSTTDVLISPRELQMMALMLVSRVQSNPQLPVDLILKQIAYSIARPLVPKTNRQACEAFDKAFKLTEEESKILDRFLTSAPSPLFAPLTKPTHFIFTPSREPSKQFLSNLLDLREWRRTKKEMITSKEEEESLKEQLYGGLGGLLLEGEPGIGKSEMVFGVLVSYGYTESHNIDYPTDKCFYRLPVNWGNEEKINFLIKAWDAGVVVIIDEINSSPLMEELLNDLLMGTYKGRRPQNPGFMVIGTQNPVTMAGRRAPSTALSRRLTTMELPPYSHEEMIYILKEKGIHHEKAIAMVAAYEKQVAVANHQHLTPEPTWRNVIHLADSLLAAQTAASHLLLEATSLDSRFVTPAFVSQRGDSSSSASSLKTERANPSAHSDAVQNPTASDEHQFQGVMHTIHFNPVNPKFEAEKIWMQQVLPRIKRGINVGLIYSTNDNQAKTIYSGYKSGPVGKIKGSGQAPIFAEIAHLIEANKLQNKVHILPIATSSRGGNNTKVGNAVTLSEINRDMANIASHHAQNWSILGFESEGRYAIGGKSVGWYDSNFRRIIKKTDGSIEEGKPSKKDTSERQSQGAYVQEILNKIECAKSIKDLPEQIQALPSIPEYIPRSKPAKFGFFSRAFQKKSYSSPQAESPDNELEQKNKEKEQSQPEPLGPQEPS